MRSHEEDTWEILPGSTYAGPADVRLVAEASKPPASHLGMVSASIAGREHSVEIQNLSTEEVWLPMQDSLDLHEVLQRQLEHLWIEKLRAVHLPRESLEYGRR